MKDSIIIGLLQNIGILLGFAMLYEVAWLKKKDPKTFLSKVVSGVAIGSIAILLMYTPWTLTTGITFDTRSILLAISGMFFGFIPTLIAVLIAIVARIMLNGEGMLMGIAVIISSGTIGLLWGKYHRLLRIKNKYLDLLLLGLVVHLAMLGCTAFLPGDTFMITIRAIAIPLIVFYAPGTMLLGILLLNQTRNVENRFAREKLSELERRLSQILKSGNIVSIILDTNANILFCNKYLLDLTGYSKKEVLYHNWFELFIAKNITDDVDQLYAATMSNKNFDNEIIGKNGTVFFISWYNTTLYNEKNEVVGV
ncbi:MAG: LytS/YhcK type 5TM receptor domain-containing protein, partial [Bacteroidales bacterium]